VYKIEQHGRTLLRRPKLSKEEVKRLMKKKKKNGIQTFCTAFPISLSLILCSCEILVTVN
jgi:hypothetical protein